MFVPVTYKEQVPPASSDNLPACAESPSEDSKVPRFIALAALHTRARADAALALETGHYHPPSVSHASDATANPYLPAANEGQTESMIHAASGRLLPTVRRHGSHSRLPLSFNGL